MLILRLFHVLAKGISADRFVDLALAYSLGAGLTPDITCTFNRDDGTGSRRDFLWGVRVLLLLLKRVMLLIGGSLLTFLFLLAFVLVPGWLMLLARLLVSPSGLHAGWTLLIGLLRHPLVFIVQDVCDIYRDVLGIVPDDVVLALRDAASRSAVDDFWSIWSKNAEAGLFRAYALAGGPIAAGSSAFLGRGLLRIRSRRLGGRAVGGMGSSRLYRISQSDEVE